VGVIACVGRRLLCHLIGWLLAGCLLLVGGGGACSERVFSLVQWLAGCAGFVPLVVVLYTYHLLVGHSVQFGDFGGEGASKRVYSMRLDESVVLEKKDTHTHILAGKLLLTYSRKYSQKIQYSEYS
jgi:hypothetical protein